MSRKNRRRDRYDNMFEEYYDDYSGYEEVSSDSQKPTYTQNTSREGFSPASANATPRKEVSEEREAWQSVLQEQEGNETPEILPEPNRFGLFLKQGVSAALAGGTRGGKWLVRNSRKIFFGGFQKLAHLGSWGWRTCRKMPRYGLLIGSSLLVLAILGGGIWLWFGSSSREIAQSPPEMNQEPPAKEDVEKTSSPTTLAADSGESKLENHLLPTLDLPTSPEVETPEESPVTETALGGLPSLGGSDLPDLNAVTEAPAEDLPAESGDSVDSIMAGLGISDETASLPETTDKLPENLPLDSGLPASESSEPASLESLTADSLALPSETPLPNTLAPLETASIPEMAETADPLPIPEKAEENLTSSSPPTAMSEEEVLTLETLTPVEISKPQKKNTLADSLAAAPEADMEHILAPPGFAAEPSEAEVSDPYIQNTPSSTPKTPSSPQNPISDNLGGVEKVDNFGSLENTPSLVSADIKENQEKRRVSTDKEEEGKISNDTVYVVREGDNYWNISEKMYGTGSYFRAIAQYNSVVAPNPNKLIAGTKLLIPQISFLRSCYPALCPSSGNADTRVGESPQIGPSQVYYVIQAGDTLSDIARRQLGSASRWPEIYRLNRETLNNRFDLLVPGVELVLPPVENHIASEPSLWK